MWSFGIILYELFVGSNPSTQGSKPSLPSTINPDPDMKKWFDDCTKQEPVLRPKANDLLSVISEKYSTVANQN